MKLSEAAMIGGAPSGAAAVLVVEDEVLVRSATAGYLRDCGFVVVEAVNADEALAIVRKTPELRLVFVDVRLPGPRSGLDLVSLLQSAYPDLKLLLTTGLAPFPAVEGVTLIRKPYFLFEVERQIRALLRVPPGMKP